MKALDPLDIILTKVDRLNRDDIEDIKNLVKAYSIKKEDLKERFGLHVENYEGSKERYKSNFNYMLDIFFGE